jgi:hypothetical protein
VFPLQKEKPVKKILAALVGLACSLGLLTATATPASAVQINAKVCKNWGTVDGDVRVCVYIDYVMTASGPVRTVEGTVALEGLPGVNGIDSNPAVTVWDRKVRGCINGTGYSASNCTYDTTAGSTWDNTGNYSLSRSAFVSPGLSTGNLDKKGVAYRAMHMVHYTLHRNNWMDVEVWQSILYGANNTIVQGCKMKDINGNVTDCTGF